MKRFLIFVLAAIFTLTSGCIHVASTDRLALELATPRADKTTQQNFEELAVHSLIYAEAKLPLDDFFRRLGQGEYSDAFRKMNFHYQPSNTDSKLLKELLDRGLTPVYIELTNHTSSPITIQETDFTLNRGATILEVIPSTELPQAFHTTNYKAIAANVHNVTVTVIGFTAALIAVGILTNGFWPSSNGRLTHTNTALKNNDNKILNPTTKITHLSYENYLFQNQPVNPGETVGGVLFFNNKSKISHRELVLNLHPSPRR